jgi:hypothetical protein
MVTDPPDLCWFLATSAIEVMNLQFASVDVVCGDWHFVEEEKIHSLQLTKDMI